MPVAIAGAVVAGLASGVTVTAAGIAFSLTMTSFLTAAAGSLLMSGMSMLTAKKPKSSARSTATAAQSITTTIRQSAGTRTIIYGNIRTGGNIVFASSTNSNQYLHLVIALAGHELRSIDEVLFDDTSIPADHISSSTGEVIAGKFSGYARIIKHYGSEEQTADSHMVAEIPGWTSNHRLRGIAYLYLRLKYSQDIFPNGIPNVSAIVKGKRVYDARVPQNRWIPNPALIVNDYLSSNEYGFEAADYIDGASVVAAANVCDEIVDTTAEGFSVDHVTHETDLITMVGDVCKLATGDRVEFSTTGTLPTGISAATSYYALVHQYIGTPRIKLYDTLTNCYAASSTGLVTFSSAGSGTMTVTKTGEPRYAAAAVVERTGSLGDNLLSLLTSMGGKAVYAGGLWRVMAAVYETPTITLDEDDMVAPINISTKIARSERFNSVKGLYYSHINRWQSADYPPLHDDAAILRDGMQINRDYDLPATFRPHTAQRLSKVELKKAAQEITVDAVCNLKALQVQCGDCINLTNTRMGWTAKPFEVIALGLTYQADQIAVALTMRETAAEIYDWATTEESDVDVAPNTTLPEVFTIEAVGGLAFSSSQITTDGGDAFYNIFITWNDHPDSFVNDGGKFEIQYKLSSDTDYKPSFFVDGGVTRSDITQAVLGETYDIRIRAVNNIGVRSSWATLGGVVSGSSGGVTVTKDWGSVASAVVNSEDWGSVASAVVTYDDWGGVI